MILFSLEIYEEETLSQTIEKVIIETFQEDRKCAQEYN